MSFKRDIMNWPSRGVLVTHDYGCPPHDAEGLKRIAEGIARREQALLDARARKALHLDAEPISRGVDGQLRPSLEPNCDSDSAAAAEGSGSTIRAD